jgi:tetratricopeptide (TPR) repeat protein
MKKILFAALLLLALIVCLTFSGCSGRVDDIKDGIAAGKEGDYDKAIGLFTKAIESGELSQENLSIAYYNRGRARGEKGDYDKAIADFDKAIKINPTFAEAYGNRGYAWHLKGNYDKAIADYTKFIEIDPRNADAYGSRGYAWGKKGDYGRAIADYTKVIEIIPSDASAHNNLAWLMATCPVGRYRDGKRAVEFAEKAFELKETSFMLNTLGAAYAEAGLLDTLAAAYAEAGRFQDAIKTQEMAIAKLKQEGEMIDLPELEKRLSSYKAGKPWREK